MPNFRSYQTKVGNFSRLLKSREELEDQLTNVTLASLTIMCSNYFMEQMICDGVEKLKKSPDFYNKKLKVACEALRDKASTLNKKLSKDIVRFCGTQYINCIADMCDELDEKMIPSYKALENEILKVFKEEQKLEHPEELATIFAMDCAVFIAANISSQIREKYVEMNRVLSKLLDLNEVYQKSCAMTHLAAIRTPEDTRINLNKHLNVMSKKRRLEDIIIDPDTFSNAFLKAGFVIDKNHEENTAS